MTSKRRGNTWEARIVSYLRSVGVSAQRVRGEGTGDRGDIHTRTTAIQAKDTRSHDLAEALDQAVAQADRARLRPLVVLRRRGHPVSRAYAVMPLEEWVALMEHRDPGSSLPDRL